MPKNKNKLVKYNKKIATDIKKAAWMSLSKNSQESYQYDFELFSKFIDKDIKDVKASDVLNFKEWLEQKGYKNSTINRKIASLSKMFKVMQLAGEIQINPVEALKQIKNISTKVSKEVKISLKLKDIQKVTKIKEDDTDQDKKVKTIIKFLASTGLRISEFINIKYEAIKPFDSNNQIIRIVGKGKKERMIYVENIFLKFIKTLWPKKKDVPYLFYNIYKEPYDRIVLYYQVRDLFEATIGKRVNPHALRHFYATYLIHIKKRDIKAVSKILGHSDVSITLNSYVDTALNVKEAIIKI